MLYLEHYQNTRISCRKPFLFIRIKAH